MNTFSKDRFQQMPIIGILRGYSPDETNGILGAYRAAGLSTLEITMNTPNALHLIKETAQKYGSDLNIGAGTVCSLNDLEKAVAAGAQFVVTPILDLDIIKRCCEMGIPVFPGAYTPTEIFRAWDAGATMVKVFPAGQLGPDYIRQLKAPLDQLRLLPTGGVGFNNMEAFMEAGADGFGLGSSLFPDRFVKAKNWQALQGHFKKFADFFPSRA